jgi:hypothetical protein
MFLKNFLFISWAKSYAPGVAECRGTIIFNCLGGRIKASSGKKIDFAGFLDNQAHTNELWRENTMADKVRPNKVVCFSFQQTRCGFCFFEHRVLWNFMSTKYSDQVFPYSPWLGSIASEFEAGCQKRAP